MSVISVQNISKKYMIYHHKKEKYTALRDVLVNQFKAITQKILHPRTHEKPVNQEEFWALNNISFSVNQGDRIGIIGRNGAGKSTLLKLLSRITEPTHGIISIRGRIASLLEVGTGFHPELTGRENIFLNGAILGMSRFEIKRNFDEIVSFAGIEKFLDTPVKRYSSGMYVRLAFSVAAHLEPEILVVDEVLAVGDAEFQKRCIDKMEEVASTGRTVLFVSHNLGSIKTLCTKGLLLEKGELKYSGSVMSCIDRYLDGTSSLESRNVFRKTNQLKNDNQFISIYNSDSNQLQKNEYKHYEDIYLIVDTFLPDWNNELELSFSPLDKNKNRIFTINLPLKKFYENSNNIKIMLKIPGEFLTVGDYSWMIAINHPGVAHYDLQEDICLFSILETGSEFARYANLNYGYVYPPKYTATKLNGDYLNV